MSQYSGTSVHEAHSKAVEERMYALASEELTQGAVRVGLWAKAWSMAGGNNREAKARYLALRLEMMVAEQTLHSCVADWRLRVSMDRAA